MAESVTVSRRTSVSPSSSSTLSSASATSPVSMSSSSLQQAKQRLDHLRAMAAGAHELQPNNVARKRALSPSSASCSNNNNSSNNNNLNNNLNNNASARKKEKITSDAAVSSPSSVRKPPLKEITAQSPLDDASSSKECDINNNNNDNSEKKKLSPTFVSAMRFVVDHAEAFFPKDAADFSSIIDHVEKVDLLYPGGCHETFPLVPPLKEGYSPILDLIKTVTLIAYDFPADFGDPNDCLNDGLCMQIERAAKKKDYTLLKTLVDVFNTKMKEMLSAGRFTDAEYIKRPLTYDQSTVLLDQIYARIVTDPDALRQYKGFSKEVYGETRHPVIHDIIQRIPIQRNHIFLDLGSGIGNVVFQVAAETGCRAYGVELLETPAHFARLQYAEYKARMSLLGRTDLGIIRLKQADFLEDPQVQRIIEKCDVIFVNNYAFEAKLNTSLMHHFLAMKDGAHIVSFAAFRPLDYTITEHNMNDMASILTVQKVGYSSGGVSWTASPGEFYIHRVDRGPLRKFMKERERAGTSRRSRRG